MKDYWYSSFTPANGIEANGLQLSVKNFSDLAGNLGTTTQGPIFEIDTIRPTVTVFDISVNNTAVNDETGLTLSDTSFNHTHVASVTLVFSQ